MRLLLISFVLVCACSAAPDQVAVRFHQALAHGDGSRAFQLLSADTQARLSALAQAASDASDGVIEADPERMIVQGDPSPYPVLEGGFAEMTARIVEQATSHAVVEVTLGGAPTSTRLIREGSEWKVDLHLEADGP